MTAPSSGEDEPGAGGERGRGGGSEPAVPAVPSIPPGILIGGLSAVESVQTRARCSHVLSVRASASAVQIVCVFGRGEATLNAASRRGWRGKRMQLCQQEEFDLDRFVNPYNYSIPAFAHEHHHIQLELLDSPLTDISSPCLQPAFAFIDRWIAGEPPPPVVGGARRERRRCLLLHSVHGHSRPAAVLCAWLLQRRRGATSSLAETLCGFCLRLLACALCAAHVCSRGLMLAAVALRLRGHSRVCAAMVWCWQVGCPLHRPARHSKLWLRAAAPHARTVSVHHQISCRMHAGRGVCKVH